MRRNSKLESALSISDAYADFYGYRVNGFYISIDAYEKVRAFFWDVFGSPF